jgi:flagellar protein FlaF
MGFSISAATALIFASLFLAFGIFYPAMANGYERVEEADAAKADQNLDQAQTDITFVSYTASGNQLTITANNTGETVLIVDDIDLILQPDYGYVSWNNNDNSDAVDAQVDSDPDTNLWRPGEQIQIEFKQTGGSFTEPDRFKLVTAHGVSISGDT